MTVDTRKKAAPESVLSRWSRRKREAGQAPAASDEAPSRDAGGVTGAPLADTPAEERKPLTDADMPDIDSLDVDSDFSGFMSPGVSDELRNLALRKLFRAPLFNIRDGLDEYDEDYTSFEKLGDIVTADMKHQIEVQQQKLREKLQRESQADAELDAAESIDDDNAADAEAPAEMNEAAQVAAVSPGEMKPKVTGGGHE